MKLKLKMFALLSLIMVFSSTLLAQTFEGKVTYSIEYLDVPEELEGMESWLPSEIVKYVQGSKVRIEQESFMGMQVVISDFDANTSIVLMDVLGNKVAMEVPEEEIEMEAAAASEAEIQYTKESKTIAGYKCKKAIISGEGFITPAIVYYTTKIPYVESQFGGLKGFPLEMTVYNDGVQMKMTAQSVTEVDVDDSLFIIPEEYSLMSAEELMEYFGGE